MKYAVILLLTLLGGPLRERLSDGSAHDALDRVLPRSARIEVLWVARGGFRPMFPIPVLVSRSVVVHASSTGLTCFDRRKGDRLWRAPGRFDQGPGILVKESLVTSLPPDAIALYAAREGDVLRRDSLKEFLPHRPEWSATDRRSVGPGSRVARSTPPELLGDDDYRTVALGDDGAYAVFTKPGQIILDDIFRPGRRVSDLRLRTEVRGPIVWIGNQTVLVQLGESEIAVLDLEPGKVRWRKSIAGLARVCSATTDACLVDVRHSGGRALVALNPATGVEIWRTKLAPPRKPVAAPDEGSPQSHTDEDGRTVGGGIIPGRVWTELPLRGPVVMEDLLLVWYGRPIAISPKDGAVLWTLPAVREYFVTMARQGRLVFCGTANGAMIALFATREGGEQRWRCDWRKVLADVGHDPGRLGGLAEARFHDGVAYLASSSGTVFAARLPPYLR